MELKRVAREHCSVAALEMDDLTDDVGHAEHHRRQREAHRGEHEQPVQRAQPAKTSHTADVVFAGRCRGGSGARIRLLRLGAPSNVSQAGAVLGPLRAGRHGGREAHGPAAGGEEEGEGEDEVDGPRQQAADQTQQLREEGNTVRHHEAEEQHRGARAAVLQVRGAGALVAVPRGEHAMQVARQDDALDDVADHHVSVQEGARGLLGAVGRHAFQQARPPRV
mmetsp:Transcript_23062/g.61549  ORF Transcript_23062/g.61549 Transcript_23062/m.61549 type:complete len:222 (-) Transcript_23062:506-1171(-)